MALHTKKLTAAGRRCKMASNKDFISDEEMIALEAQQAPDFISDEEMSKLEPIQYKEPTILDKAAPYAALLAQGVSGKLSDELSGALEAGGRVVGVKGAGGKLKDMSLGSPTINPDELKKAYIQARDQERQNLKEYDELPLSSTTEFVGGALSPLNKLAGGLGVAKQAALIGGITGFGGSESDSVSGDIANTALGAGIGFGVGKIGEKIAGKLTNKAGDLAENAVGATATQAEKMKPDTGKELLKQGIVSYLDNPEAIAAKSDTVMRQAGRTIDKTLQALDKKGVEVNVDEIVSTLENKAQELSTNPAAADVVKKLNKIIKNIYAAGESKVPVSKAEIIKRSYGNSFPKNAWFNEAKSEAEKMAYLVYRDAVDNATQVIDPELAKEFIGAKKVYGMLKPVRDAAQRRAIQQNQSPVGGLLDVATAGATATTGNVGPIGQVVAAGARREMAPRLSSTLAKGMYDVAQDVAGRGGTFNVVNNPETLSFAANQAKQTQMMTDVFNVIQNYSPYDREQYIKNDRSLTPTQRAKLLKENKYIDQQVKPVGP